MMLTRSRLWAVMRTPRSTSSAINARRVILASLFNRPSCDYVASKALVDIASCFLVARLVATQFQIEAPFHFTGCLLSSTKD